MFASEEAIESFCSKNLWHCLNVRISLGIGVVEIFK